MKLRLGEYYYIISDEFDEIEDYMPQYMQNNSLEFWGGSYRNKYRYNYKGIY